jgi:O-antigen/teichoic acid export membrane protein
VCVETPLLLRSRAARGAGNLFVGNTLSLIIQGVGAILVARLLGVEVYGLYTLLLIPSATIYVFTQLGIGGSATRYTAYYNKLGDAGEALEVVNTGLIASTILHIALTAASFVVAPYIMGSIIHRPSLSSYAQLASLVIVFQGLTNFCTSVFNGYFKTVQTSIVLFLQASVKTAGSIALIVLGYGLEGAVLGLVLSYVVSGLTGLGMLLIMLDLKKPKDFKGELGKILSFGLPTYAANLLNGLSRQVQLIILAMVASASAVGAFSASANLVGFIGIVSFPLSTILVPTFSEISAQRDGGRMSSSYTKATVLSTTLVAPVAFYMIFLAQPLFSAFYGHGYVDFYYVLAALAVGYLGVAIGGQTQTSFFAGISNTRINAAVAMIQAASLVSLSIGLGYALGVTGVALATSAAMIISALFAHYTYLKRRYLATIPSRTMILIFLTGLAAGALTFLLAPHKPVHGLVGVGEAFALFLVYTALYTTILPLTRALSRDDLLLLSESFASLQGINRFVKLIVSYMMRLAKLSGQKN